MAEEMEEVDTDKAPEEVELVDLGEDFDGEVVILN